jgi:adenylate cyclase
LRKAANLAQEIERKFMVVGDAWRGLAPGTSYRQGYLLTSTSRSVRVRAAGDKAYLTIKGATVGATRLEFEYESPNDEANEMLDRLCDKPIIEKTRYCIPFGEFTWEVDEFHGANAGLIIAEIELESEEQAFDKPNWIGKEVTEDPRYYNANLAKRPYCDW